MYGSRFISATTASIQQLRSLISYHLLVKYSMFQANKQFNNSGSQMMIWSLLIHGKTVANSNSIGSKEKMVVQLQISMKKFSRLIKMQG